MLLIVLGDLRIFRSKPVDRRCSPPGWNSHANTSPSCPSNSMIGANKLDVRFTPYKKLYFILNLQYEKFKQNVSRKFYLRLQAALCPDLLQQPAHFLHVSCPALQQAHLMYVLPFSVIFSIYFFNEKQYFCLFQSFSYVHQINKMFFFI